MITALAAAVAVIALLWAAYAFNRLTRLRNQTQAGWSDIDVQLQRRHDLIPQLAEAVSAYARHEQTTLTAIANLRSLSEQAEHLAAKAAAEEALTAMSKRLLALAEDYPELKASQNFLSLQSELGNTEDLLQYARRFYNGAVRDFNTRIESFPDLLVARLCGFRAREFFRAEAAAADAVRIGLD